MHPAFSVIFFTTSSGAGYGMLALLGVLAPLELVPAGRWFAATSLGFALALISAGLIASTFHLGHPERAWRSISQWRSSWLSREGIAALVTYIPAGVFALGWIIVGSPAGPLAWIGVASAVMAAITLYCTAMIYAALRPVHQWHNSHVTPVYLLLALSSGAVWLNALVLMWGQPVRDVGLLALLALATAAWAKWRYWRFIDTTRAPSTPETATGLVGRGKVRLLDPPHTEENFLQQEMGFRIARKHARKLRRIALGLGFGLPVVLVVLTLVTAGVVAAVVALLAALSSMLGILIERWLFFAEAKHTVMLYYGATGA